MSDEMKLQDSPTPEEELKALELELEKDDLSPEPDKKVEFSDRERRLYKRFKDLEVKYEAVKKQDPPKAAKEELSPKSDDFDAIFDKLSAVRDLSTEELAEMRSEAKTIGIDPIRFLQSKAGKTYLDSYRQTKKSADTTLAPTKRSIVYKGRTLDQVLTDEKASGGDKQAAFEARLRQGRTSSE